MGTNTPISGPEELQSTKMKIFLALQAISLTFSLPQYGPTPPSQEYLPPPPPRQYLPAPRPQYNPLPVKPQVADQSSDKTKCHPEYVTVWDTRYIETETKDCTTEQVNKCTTKYKEQCKETTSEECIVIDARECNTVERKVCREYFERVSEPLRETQCNTLYKEDCESRWEGEGNDKVWVIIPDTCRTNPYEKCTEVVQQVERSVPRTICNRVPEEKCVIVPSKRCRQVPEQKCTQEPWTFCTKQPEKKCKNVHKRVPQRFSRTINKKVCDGNSLNNILEKQTKRKSKAVVFEED